MSVDGRELGWGLCCWRLVGVVEGLADGFALEVQVGCDGLVVGELPVEVGQDLPEAGRVWRQLVHMFDSMMVGVNSNLPGRYHLLLASAGRPVQHGYWGSEAVARAKFTRWIGEHGGLPDATVTLVDEKAGTVLTAWPEEP